MKIDRISLKNIRCFDELEISLGGRSALIIGDNGDGKSTVIRSLAMGLCDDSSAAALFRELHGETVRKPTKTGKTGRIEVDFIGHAKQYHTVTKISSLTKFERVDQELFVTGPMIKTHRRIDQMKFPWARIFAVGYGAGTRVQGTADYDYYLAADAVYPLFRYDAPLQNPELVFWRLVESARRSGGPDAAEERLNQIKTLLKNVLQLADQDQVELTRRGITVRSSWGRSELSSLGDGYRSTVTWILDLLSWWFLRSSNTRDVKNPAAIQGIVLIDEIEQHLHPKWQRNIVRLLTESFPNVQFIATTHSPLVASGCEGIPVHRLSGGKHSVEHPYGWLAEDVYRMMDVPTSRAEGLVKQLTEFEKLDIKRLRRRATKLDLSRLASIRRELDDMPQDDPLRLISELKNLRKSLGSVD